MPDHDYHFIKSHPSRTCRSETLIRLLISTSYPKSLFTNLGILFNETTLDVSRDSLNETAKVLRKLERDYSMLDFARSLTINKVDNVVKLKLNTLKFDPTASEIVDSKESHHCLIDLNIEDVVIKDDSAKAIAELILINFYNVQRRNKRLTKDIRELKWQTSNRREDNDGRVLICKNTHNFDSIADIVKHSLLKSNFGILILQNVLILSDQRCRIFFKEEHQ